DFAGGGEVARQSRKRISPLRSQRARRSEMAYRKFSLGCVEDLEARFVRSRNLGLAVAIVIAGLCSHEARAQAPAVDPTFASLTAEWRAPFAPHHVVGNV